MSNKTGKVFAAVLALALALCFAVPAFAAAYAPVSGDAVHGFKQFLIIDEDARVPSIEFSYSIAPGSAVAPEAGRMAVLAGVGTPSIGSAVFTEGEAVSAASAPGVTLSSTQRFAEKTVNYNFSGVSFPEPGIYRYVVTMTSSGQQAVDYDIQKGASALEKQRILDVYVIDESGVLKVDSYALHELSAPIPTTPQGGSGSVATVHERLADKSEGFVNLYATQDLEFGKEITGNQGAKDKYFEFSLKVSGAAPNTTYIVDIANAESASGSTEATAVGNRNQSNPTQFKTDASGAASVKYYLCDGQYVYVKGLPRDSKYALSENREDYVSENGIAASIAKGSAAHLDPVSGTIAAADIMTGFTNTRNGIVPTGLITAVAPAAGVFAAGGAGLAVMLLGRKHREDGDEKA